MTHAPLSHAPAGTRAARRLGGLFFLLALWLAWFVTPHGDIPDESGHYGYIQEIADQGTLPLLGRSTMARDIWRDVEGLQGKPRPNYIAQHPPLYYAIAAVPYRLLRTVTDRKDLLPKAPRLVSAAALGILICLLDLTLLEAGLTMETATAGAAAFGLIPLVPHLSSGIGNDIFLTLLAAGATLSLVRCVGGQGLRHAYVCALWLAAAGATKMTAWVLIAVYLTILLWELRETGRRWVLHALGLAAVSVSTSAAWMVRNAYHFGDPLHVYGSDFKQKVFDQTHWDYLAGQPFVDQVFDNLYVSIGFSGYCQTPTTVDTIVHLCRGVRVMPEDLLGTTAFALLCALAVGGLLGAQVRRLGWPGPDTGAPKAVPLSLQERLRGAVGDRLQGRLAVALCLAVAAAVAVPVALLARDPASIPGWFRLTPLLLLLALVPSSLLLATGAKYPASRLMAYGALSLMLMVLLLFHMGYKSYLINGFPRGLQGRYLLPFLPLMIVSVGLAIRDSRWATPIAVVLVSAMAALFLHTYAGLVIPFYQSVRV